MKHRITSFKLKPIGHTKTVNSIVYVDMHRRNGFSCLSKLLQLVFLQGEAEKVEIKH